MTAVVVKSQEEEITINSMSSKTEAEASLEQLTVDQWEKYITVTLYLTIF